MSTQSHLTPKCGFPAVITKRQTAGILLAISLVGTAEAQYDGTCSTLDDLRNIPAGHWCEVPNSHLDQVEKRPSEWPDYNGSSSASYESYQRNIGIEGIMSAWNGGTYDTRRNRLLIFGGGHNAYAGNEIYAFDLDTLRWNRLTDPTPFPRRNAVENNDGTPTSRHSYGGLAYMENLDQLFVLGGAPDSETGGCGVAGTWRFDFRLLETNGYSPSQWQRGTSDGEPRTRCEDDAIYDSVTGHVYYNFGFSPSGISVYDPVADSWTNLTSAAKIYGSSSTIPGDRRFIVTIGEYQGNAPDGYVKWDGVGTSALSKSVVATTGSKAMERAKNPGIAYDPTVDRVVAWAGGTSVYSLDVDARVWTQHSAQPGNQANPGSVDASGGTYGRFAYSATHNVYVTVDAVNENVFLYRLADGTGIPQEPIPTPPVIQVE